MTGGGSKALVRLGGLALVERAVRTLLSYGLERVVVVTGYHGGPVAAVVGRLAPGRVQAVFAEDWAEGNGASLAAAAPEVEQEDLFVLVTADHVFGEGALHGLLRAGRPAGLVDAGADQTTWGEGTKVRVERGGVVAFSKDIDEPAIDCGVFLLPPAVFDAQREAAREGDTSLSGAVTRLARTTPLAPVQLPDGVWWQDVDTPEDFTRARKELRRALTKAEDGPVSRAVNRPISTRISMALAPARVSPDLVSVLVVLVGVASAWLLAVGQGLLGGVLAHATSVLDGVDGELARLQIRAGPRGALLDGVLDRLADAAILAGLGIWALQETASPELALALTVSATSGAMLSMATKDRISAYGLPLAPERAIGFLLGGRDGRLLIVAVAAVFGEPLIGLIAVTATSTVALAARVIAVRRETRHL